ncbi:MAG: restriction endonuclease subunit S [Bacteroidales bacterium]|nr:restriction endonuclease subunit S [Bacteroidales bacterium]
MTEWKEYKLGEIGTFGNGKVRPQKQGDIPIYGGNGILGYCDEYNYCGETIIVGRVGAYCGSVYYENRPIWVSDNALALKPKNNYNTKFIYYLLKKYNLNEYAEGSSHPLVTQTLLNAIEIIFTDDIEKQIRIAAIFSSLDDKIDLLHRENKTLEAMAETLFRQWFIEEAKEDDMCLLGEVIKTTSGGTPSRKNEEYYCNGNIEWVKSKELHHSYILDTEEKITEDAITNSSAKLLPENSVLIAMYGATVGEYGIISKPMTCNQAICALIPNENYPYTYLYLWAKYMQEEFINLACGAAQQNISQELIKQQYVSNDLKQILDFHILVAPYLEKMKVNQEMIQTLIQTRDSLLPKLMSGEIKV